jgi:hypothetical protein
MYHIVPKNQPQIATKSFPELADIAYLPEIKQYFQYHWFWKPQQEQRELVQY